MDRNVTNKLTHCFNTGIAANTRLAKVCSDLNKPNGQYYLPPDKERILEFVSNLSIRKVSAAYQVVGKLILMHKLMLVGSTIFLKLQAKSLKFFPKMAAMVKEWGHPAWVVLTAYLYQ